MSQWLESGRLALRLGYPGTAKIHFRRAVERDGSHEAYLELMCIMVSEISCKWIDAWAEAAAEIAATAVTTRLFQDLDWVELD